MPWCPKVPHRPRGACLVPVQGPSTPAFLQYSEGAASHYGPIAGLGCWLHFAVLMWHPLVHCHTAGDSRYGGSLCTLPHCRMHRAVEIRRAALQGAVASGTSLVHCHTAEGSGQWNSICTLPHYRGSGQKKFFSTILLCRGQRNSRRTAQGTEILQHIATLHRAVDNGLHQNSATLRGQWAVDLRLYTSAL